ncbi:hypothetical protein Q4F19_12500 [Sphingomonas sp. BIUV-7]|uniref:Uncharacterized protein n=1 Tax=Sphingomonas natans TaxID=3063330 RepID=A0ABT8YA37_9SPHN|nr:hypothetical protein [Sphingomonas sp. BIUV-7]MDO6415204.1 hypothetical protein [Sphingomonas sp. BIUV-7]
MTEPVPHFHDGYVTGLSLRERAAAIYLQDVVGSDYELVLDGLEALQIDDFREGNIISNVEIITGRTPDADTDFDRLFVPPHPSAATQYQEAHALLMKRQIARIESGETCLVVIVPSLGADLLAICQGVLCRPV